MAARRALVLLALATLLGQRRFARASYSPDEGACPAELSRSVGAAAGCACNPLPNAQFGRCAAGYVCSQGWAQPQAAAASARRQLLVAGSDPSAASSGGGSLYPLPTTTSDPAVPGPSFTCTPCFLGQYCPDGSVLPPSDSPTIQLALNALECPASKYCPTPADIQDCPPSFFCSAGTVQPMGCNMTELLVSVPGMPVPKPPVSVFASVYVFGTDLAGNTCPANSTSPIKECPGGFYCPTPKVQELCPAGHFCKPGSREPSPCPMLARCPQGSAAAQLSWIGFITLGGILAALWLAYLLLTALIRVNQRALLRRHEARDRLWRLLASTPLLAPAAPGAPTAAGQRPFRAFRSVRPRLDVEFQGLGLTLHDGTTILSGVSGTFRHSRVVAVMGPSGAGKSTFLSVLMGRAAQSGRPQGRVLVNGRPVRSMQQLQAITGFVPQEDIVHEDLTVRENLAYSARLRLSSAKPLAEQRLLVEDVVDALQLRHVQHQVVGSVERRGISGGQRKRVNIGMELASKPSVLFMDEPTSGLDATAAADILGALRRMASLGMNIVCVIHQPRFSIFQMFSEVMLLGKGGRLVFLGPSGLALPYFQSLGFALPPNENPADFCMDLVSGGVPRQGAASFQPEDLFGLWEGHGRSWVGMHSKLAGPEASGAAAVEAPARVDPEQLQLLEQAFDEADSDGDGALDAAQLQQLLEGLGLEPAGRDVAAIMAELAVPRTGLLPRAAFLQYVRHAGRPPLEEAIPAQRRRAVQSMYRVYSIEQYTLANALSELAAAQLSPGLLRGVAALPAAQPLVLDSQESLSSEAASTIADAAGQAWRQGSAASTSSEQPVPLTLPLPHDAAGSSAEQAAQGGPGYQRQDAFVLRHADVAAAQGGPELQRQDAFALRPSAPGSEQKQQHLLAAVAEVDREATAALTSAPSSHSGPLANGSARSLRATPGMARQLATLLVRALTKWARNWGASFSNYLLLIFAAVVCGFMHGTASDEWDVRGHAALVMLTLGILSAASSLSVFGRDRIVWWREQASGVRAPAYFLAHTATNFVDIAVQPLIFLSIYHSMTLPAIPFLQLYVVGLLTVWFCSSVACLLSVLVPPASSLVAAVACVMVLGGQLNGVTPNFRGMSPAIRGISSISYNRWAVEAISIMEFAQWPAWRSPASKAVMNQAGYCNLLAVALDPIAPGELGAAWVPSPAQTELEVRSYCAGYAKYALIIIAAEGLILRLLTCLALAYCSRGLHLDGLLVWAAGRTRRQRKAKRATSPAGGAVTVTAAAAAAAPGV